MFPEFSELINQLKSTDAHFDSLHQRHAALDQHVQRIVSRVEPATDEVMETLKKEKLLLKDEIYAILKKAAKA
jgi:uncharacterized protein YdcH (DUF465 family)